MPVIYHAQWFKSHRHIKSHTSMYSSNPGDFDFVLNGNWAPERATVCLIRVSLTDYRYRMAVENAELNRKTLEEEKNKLHDCCCCYEQKKKSNFADTICKTCKSFMCHDCVYNFINNNRSQVEYIAGNVDDPYDDGDMVLKCFMCRSTFTLPV